MGFTVRHRSSAAPLLANKSSGSSLGGIELAGLGLLLVVAPVIVDPLGHSGYLAVKVLAASLGVGLLCAFLGWSRAAVLPGGKVAAAAGVGLVVMTAATLTSSTWERSLLGAPQRLSGLLMWLGLAVAFVAGFSLRHRRGESVEMAISRLSVIAMLVVGILAVLEAGGVDWDPGALEFDGRLRSTLGNPSVLAGFVVLVGPLCASAVSSTGYWRWAALAACGLAGFTLVGTQTRGAIAALVITAMVFALVRASWKLRLWVVAGVVATLGATALVGRWNDVGFGLRGRVAIWEVAIEAIADRPWLGFGPEMFVVEYSERVSAETVREFGRSGAVDRAHSGLLDFAVSFGTPAAVLYLAVLAAIGIGALRAMASRRWVPAALGFGLMAYVLQQQVFFPHPATDAVFWLLVGVLAAAVGPRAVPIRSRWVAATLTLIVLGSAFNSWSAVRNDHDFERAVKARSYAAAYGHLSAAVERRPFDDEPYILMGALLQNVDDMTFISAGEVQINRGRSRNPGNELISLALADVRLQASRVSGDRSWAIRARMGLDEILRSQPTNAGAYLKRGVAAYYLGDLETAESDWQQAAWLLPEDETPSNNLKALRSQLAHED